MFKCQFCGTQVPRGVSPKMVVTGKRDRVYSQKWVRVRILEVPGDKWQGGKQADPKRRNKKKPKPRFKDTLVPEHVGWEITGECKACQRCATRNL